MPASESGIGSSAELEVVRPSTFGTVMLVLLVLISLGLVVGSVLVHGTPDPRPLLEELWRRYLGG